MIKKAAAALKGRATQIRAACLDGLAIAGVLATAHGVDLISRPAAFIVGGLVLTGSAIWLTRKVR